MNGEKGMRKESEEERKEGRGKEERKGEKSKLENEGSQGKKGGKHTMISKRRCDLSQLTCDVVDLLLVLLHSRNVVFEGGHLVSAARSVVTENVGNFLPVGRVFVDTELHVLGELFVELLAHVFVFHDFLEHFHAFLDQVLTNDFQDFVLEKKRG